MEAGERRGEPAGDGSTPAADWERAREAIADGTIVETLREHLADGEGRCLEWCPICRTAELLRANASPELREQWSSVQREALLTVRTLLDHYLERTEAEPGERQARVQDIPIE